MKTGFLKKVWFVGESSYSKDIGRFIFAIMLLILCFEYFEHEFRLQAVGREKEKDQLLMLANHDMNIAGKIVEESVWLVNSRDEAELAMRKERVKQLLFTFKDAHKELLEHSRYIGITLSSSNPVEYMDKYYRSLTGNIRALLELDRRVLTSLGTDADTLRQVLSERPGSGDDSEAFSLDLEKLAFLFRKANRNRASFNSRMEFYLGLFKLSAWLIIGGAVYYVVRKGHRRDLEFKRTHEELKKERDKLSLHHEEDQLNIGTAKLLFSLINGPIPRHTVMPGGLSMFCESIVNSCHKEGGDHSGIINSGDYIYFYNADEAGHEVSTVLWSIVSRVMLKRSINLENGSDSGEEKDRVPRIMSTLNRILNIAYPEFHFCTMVLGRIDTRTLEMHYSRAAHPEFYVIRGEKVYSLPADDNDYRGDPFMGILEDVIYQQGMFQLEPGDKIMLLTDGFVEACRKGADGREIAFGFSRIKDALSVNSHLPVHLIFERLCLAVEEFTGKKLGCVVSKKADGPREYCVKCRNELDDDASALLIQIDPVYDFDMVFELEQENLDELTVRVAEIWSEELSPFMKREGFAQGSLFGARMAFDEAVVNAFKHACSGAFHTIKVGISVRNDLVIHVFDQGPGFDPSLVPDPTASENLLRSSGRGFYLIKEYSSECSWSSLNFEKYTFCLQMIFKRYPDLADKQSIEKMRIMSLLR